MNIITIAVFIIIGIMLFIIAYCMHRIEKHKEALAELKSLLDKESKEKESYKSCHVEAESQILGNERVIKRLEHEKQELESKLKSLNNHIIAERGSYEKKLKTLGNAYARLKRQKQKDP